MRRFEIKLIYDLLDALTDIHKIIKDEYKAGQTETAINLLCNCQDSAVSIGKIVEKEKEKNYPTIQRLESYCDDLYSIAQKIVSQNCTKKDFDKLRKQHYSIRQDIEKNITTKLEIVFLPYKASMWGSLESIWKAAQDDPDCDAFVIPIPYYDRKPDQSLGDMHYEGDQFPDYVPITYYKKYDLSRRKPDAIFIHNPYDGNNLVTMVDPQYFSTVLKTYTDCLVYVPYFACASLDSIEKQFLLMPGVLNADYVVVQSEKIKDAYIDGYEEYTGRKADKNKYLSLGSPMLDKVISTKREDISVPEEWKEIIAGKKIVLYNTSIKGILVHGERAFAKMEDVFRTFQKQDNVVILWRPHPLNHSTISSMNPSLLNKYEELIEQFNNNNWGIYDDTPDVHRAIALSDAYYGDGGSLLPLYWSTGKPVLVQNPFQTEFHRMGAIAFNSWFREKNRAWFPSANFNGLIEIDLETIHTMFLAEFPIELKNNNRVVSGITKCGDTLVIAALDQKCLFCYDLSNHSMSKIDYDLPSSLTKYDGTHAYFRAAHSFKDKVYFFGHKYPIILMLDMSNKKVSTIIVSLSEMERQSQNNGEAFFTPGLQRGKNYYAPCLCINAVVELDLENGNTSIIEIPNSGNGFSGIAFDGENFWFSPQKNGPIVSWNKETEDIKEYRDYPGSKECSRASFRSILYKNGFVWLVPAFAPKVLKINCRDGSIYEVTELNEICSQENKKMPSFPIKFRACHSGDGSEIWLHDGASFSLICFDTEKGILKRSELMTPKIQSYLNAKKLKSRLLDSDTSELSTGYMREKPRNQLRDYLSFVSNLTTDQNLNRVALLNSKFANADGSCGKKTYATINKDLL